MGKLKEVLESVQAVLEKFKLIIGMLSLLLVIGVCAISYQNYLDNIEGILLGEEYKNAEKVAQQGADIVEDKFHSLIKIVESYASSISKFGALDSTTAKTIATSIATQNPHISRLVVSRADGMSYGTDGLSGNLKGTSTFESTMLGQTVVESIYSESSDLSSNSNVFLISVPIKNASGAVFGALSCVYNGGITEEIMTLDVESTEAKYCIVDTNGDLIIQSNKLIGLSLFEIGVGIDPIVAEEIISGMNKYHYGAVEYTYNGKKFYAGYHDLAFEDWYLLSLIPEQNAYIGGDVSLFQTVLQVTGITFVMIVILFLLLVLTKLFGKSGGGSSGDIDSITRIPNEEALEKFYSALPKNGEGYAYIHMHINKFKDIVTTFGIEPANNVLKSIAKSLDDNVGDGEIAGHLGGSSSFAIIAKFTTAEALMDKKLSVLDKFSDIKVTDGNLEFEHKITYSIGIYVIQGNEGSFKDVLNMARFSATLSRNNPNADPVTFFDDNMRKDLELRNNLLAMIKTAFQENQFEPYIQPKYDLEQKKINAAELFTKWNHPEHGIIEPGTFLPVMEFSGDVLQLDLYIFEVGCKLIKKWIDEERMPVPLSINISRYNLYQSTFGEKIVEISSEHKVPTCLLCLEIEQPSFFINREKTIEVMKQFHELGFILCVDHYGESTIPIDIFYDYPLDIINLSSKFIKRARGNDEVRSIMETVVKMAKRMTISLFGVGVEIQEDEAILTGIGCFLVQGYLYSKPEHRDDFEKMIF